MAGIAVQGDGYVTEYTEGGSQIRWAQTGTGDDPLSILPSVIGRIRALNRINAAREYSLAITHTEEALHWLQALERRRTDGQ